MKKFTFLCFLIVQFGKVQAQNITITPEGITPAAGLTYPRTNYEAILALPSPLEGDLAYDTTYKCLRVYSEGEWSCSYQNTRPGLTTIKSAGGSNADNGTAIAVDTSGNVYVTGSYNGVVDWGSGNLSSLNNSNDIFVAKYNQSGVLQWVRSAGGNNNDNATDIVVDNYTGNVFIIGTIGTGTATFGSITITGQNASNYFLAKYSNSGTVDWVKEVSGTLQSIKKSVNNLYIYTTGTYEGTVTFGDTTLTSQGGSDVFVISHDFNGGRHWIQSAGGSDNDSALDISIDENGKLYLMGEFRGTATFGSISKTAAGASEVFIAKYDHTVRNWVWAESAKGSKIAVDYNENLYTVGTYTGSLLFGSGTLTAVGGNDIFFTKYNSKGSLQWAKSAGGTGDDIATDIFVDAKGNIGLTGYFTNTTTFGAMSKTSLGASDIFVARFYNNGLLQWLQSAGGSLSDSGTGVAMDSSGSIYATGSYSGTATFGESTNTSNGASDIFIIRLD